MLDLEYQFNLRFSFFFKDTKAAPSLQEYQRKLKKARLADDLNDKLLNRPGPLELVEYGILVSDTSLTEAIKGEKLVIVEKTA